MQARYTTIAIWLHWIIAIVVIVQVALGWTSDRLPRPESGPYLDQHTRFGILILGLMLLRLFWRIGHTPPAMDQALPAWQRTVAKGAHLIFYLLLLGMPISGYVMWGWSGRELDLWGIVTVPPLLAGGDDETWRGIFANMHEMAAIVLSGLIVLHVAGAIQHQLKHGVDIFERMGPKR